MKLLTIILNVNFYVFYYSSIVFNVNLSILKYSLLIKLCELNHILRFSIS